MACCNRKLCVFHRAGDARAAADAASPAVKGPKIGLERVAFISIHATRSILLFSHVEKLGTGAHFRATCSTFPNGSSPTRSLPPPVAGRQQKTRGAPLAYRAGNSDRRPPAMTGSSVKTAAAWQTVHEPKALQPHGPDRFVLVRLPLAVGPDHAAPCADRKRAARPLAMCEHQA